MVTSKGHIRLLIRSSAAEVASDVLHPLIPGIGSVKLLVATLGRTLHVDWQVATLLPGCFLVVLEALFRLLGRFLAPVMT
jgi:hypothetical protein